MIPNDREGNFSTKLFSRYQRNEKALVLALQEMYLQGVSTRKGKEITEVLCGLEFSKSLVSDLAKDLDLEIEDYRALNSSRLMTMVVLLMQHTVIFITLPGKDVSFTSQKI